MAPREFHSGKKGGVNSNKIHSPLFFALTALISAVTYSLLHLLQKLEEWGHEEWARYCLLCKTQDLNPYALNNWRAKVRG
jgi:hypothetical protein